MPVSRWWCEETSKDIIWEFEDLLCHKDIKLNKSWALQDMKTFYDIQGEVTHDALNDAKDLALIFKCYQEKKTLNKEAILNC